MVYLTRNSSNHAQRSLRLNLNPKIKSLALSNLRRADGIFVQIRGFSSFHGKKLLLKKIGKDIFNTDHIFTKKRKNNYKLW